MTARRRRSSGGNVTGSFPSHVKGEKVVYASTIERDFVYFLKFDLSVITYQYEPMTIIGRDTEGIFHSYTPDFLVTRMDRKEIIECKPEALLEHLHTKRQIELGEAWAEANNHHFVLVTDTDLRKDHTLANLKLLWRYRDWTVPTAILASCIAYVKAQPMGLSFEELTRFLSSLANTAELQQLYKQIPLIYNMLFRHILETDLSKPLSPTTLLRISSRLS